MLSRRSVLAAATALVPLAFQDQILPIVRAATLRKRYAVTSVAGKASLKAFATAINVMQGKDPNHPISREIRNTGPSHPYSWEKQRLIHAGMWDQHSSWNFFPWHRLQLVCLESIVAKLIGDQSFALPYWDPREHKTIPAEFFQESSPLFLAGRDVDAATDFAALLQTSAQGHAWPTASQLSGDFRAFCGGPSTLPSPTDRPTADAGSVSNNTHGAIHNWIGGRMGNPHTATLDPLFWLHHANIDRVWPAWQKRHSAMQASAYEPAFLNASLGRPSPFVCPAGDVSIWTPRNLIDCSALGLGLGYSYDEEYPLGEFALPPVAKSISHEQSSSWSPASATVGSAAVMTCDLSESLAAAHERLVKCVARIRMRPDGFDSLLVRVSLASAASPSPDEQAFCELLAPFGLFHDDSGISPYSAAYFSVDITDQLRAALAGGAPDNISLVFDPIPRSKQLPRSMPRVYIEKITLETQLRAT